MHGMASIKRPVLAALVTALVIPVVGLLAVSGVALFELAVPPDGPGFVSNRDLALDALNWGMQGATAAFLVLAPLLWAMLQWRARPHALALLGVTVIVLVPAWLLAGEQNPATAALMLVWVPPCWLVLWWMLRE